MPKIKFNEANRKYYSEDFIKGFKCGTERQYKADQKTGYWIEDDFTGIIKCSICDNDAPISTTSGEQYCSKYCPNCGAKMEVKNK